jgi:hypothetical protein
VPVVYCLELLTAVSLILGVFVRLVSFALHHYGRSLGVDALIVARLRKPRTLGRIILAEAG